jgi:hypothetical protein
MMMSESNTYLDHISLIQQQMEEEFHQKVSMFQAIAIWLSQGLTEQDKLIKEENDFQINYLQG